MKNFEFAAQQLAKLNCAGDTPEAFGRRSSKPDFGPAYLRYLNADNGPTIHAGCEGVEHQALGATLHSLFYDPTYSLHDHKRAAELHDKAAKEPHIRGTVAAGMHKRLADLHRYMHSRPHFNEDNE